MPANLENSAVATGLEKVSFHSNSKERQCQRMLKLLHRPIIVQCYRTAECVSWIPRLTLLNLEISWTYEEHVLGIELICFFDDPTDVGNLISGSSAFSKSSLNIWNFTVHRLLKPGLEKFEPSLLACEMSAIVW